jgi:regulator of chromosome condensation
VLTEHGNVYSFGLNNMGQLGLGSLEPNHTGTPSLVRALEGKGVESLCGGEHHSLALTSSGEVYAFGRGDNNQLGFADGTDQEVTPRLIPSLSGVAVRKVSTLANSNFAVSRTGDLYCWGFGEMGQLCNGRGGDDAAPALVQTGALGGKAVLDVASGAQHSVILAMDRADE